MAYSRNKIFFSISTVVMFCLALYVAQRLLWNAHLSSWLKIIFCLLIFGLSSISIMRLLVTRAAGLPFYWMRVGGYASSLFLLLGSLTFLRDCILILLHVFSALFSLNWTADAALALTSGKATVL